MADPDPVLAETMTRLGVPAPRERILRTDYLATALNRDKLGAIKRIVDLECGHKKITSNKKTALCSRCHRIILEGYDYDAFRNLRTISDPIEDDDGAVVTETEE